MPYNTNPAEEIYFWSGIMRDHGEFMIISFSPRETEFVRTAQQFKNAFISIRNEAKGCLEVCNPQQSAALINKVLPVVVSFINFKRMLLQRLLQCCIELRLPPTFINHMINEAMDFYNTLCKLQSNAPIDPTIENINLHKIWLPDAAGHAGAIASDLDGVETTLIKEAEDFKNTFEHLFIKTFELGLMLERTYLNDGSLQRLNEEAECKINEFICYLAKIKELREKCKALGVIKPLMPDHMIREETYYLTKLKKFKCV